MSSSDTFQAIVAIPVLIFAIYQTYLMYQMRNIMRDYFLIYTLAKPLRAEA